MGLFTRDIKTMDDLFVHQLQDIYYAEQQLVKALPKLADKATEKQLKQDFLLHLDETRIHVQRLDKVGLVGGHFVRVREDEDGVVTVRLRCLEQAADLVVCFSQGSQHLLPSYLWLGK